MNPSMLTAFIPTSVMEMASDTASRAIVGKAAVIDTVVGAQIGRMENLTTQPIITMPGCPISMTTSLSVQSGDSFLKMVRQPI